MKLEAKTYKGTFIQGSQQIGTTKNGHPQIALDITLKTPDGDHSVTTFLTFSEAASPYSEERLVALGWAGKGNDVDFAKLTNEVDVQVSYRTWEGKEQMDVQIQTGSGRVKLKNAMDQAQEKNFLSRLAGKPAGAKVDPGF